MTRETKTTPQTREKNQKKDFAAALWPPEGELEGNVPLFWRIKLELHTKMQWRRMSGFSNAQTDMLATLSEKN